MLRLMYHVRSQIVKEETTVISAFRTGEIAGSAAAQNSNISMGVAARQLALIALTERERIGIAHCYPIEEFIQGFIAGYNNPQPGTDGLQLAVLAARSAQ